MVICDWVIAVHVENIYIYRFKPVEFDGLSSNSELR
jgi:hypothetical protein